MRTAVFLLLIFAAPQVFAGSGAFDGASYTFCVAVLFNASASDIALMQTVFTAASQVTVSRVDHFEPWSYACLTLCNPV